jgi:hypothetical protein
MVDGFCELVFSVLGARISAKSVEEVLKLGRCLTDRGPWAGLKHDYALAIFTLPNVMKLIAASKPAEALFIAPMALAMCALRESGLTDGGRLQLMQATYVV